MAYFGSLRPALLMENDPAVYRGGIIRFGSFFKPVSILMVLLILLGVEKVIYRYLRPFAMHI